MMSSSNEYEPSNSLPGKPQNRLEIYTLGQFSVRRNKELLSAKFGRLNKSWELFIYLITHRDKLFPVEVIQEALWPEEEYSDPSKNLRNQVHRLRKIIDPEQQADKYSAVLYSHGCYSWNRDISYWLDVEAFENLCNQARSQAEKNPAEAMETYKNALSLYRGDYLPEFSYSEWVIPVRHYYRQLFIRSVLELLDLCKEVGKYQEMAKLCEKTFMVEQCDEEVHQRYLEALMKQNKMIQARSHYQYITALLYREFGSKPSTAMQRLYREMKNSIGELELDFADIKELLKEHQPQSGALYCDTEAFELICKLEKRRVKRENKSMYIATLTLTGPDYRLPPPSDLMNAMEKMKEVLFSSLRGNDVFTRWNESQFVVLLSIAGEKQADNIIARICERFSQSIPGDLVVPRSTLHSFSHS